MVVIVMEKASARLRGELTRWLMETKNGVFVGKISALVRDKLWEKICNEAPVVSSLMIYSAANEQGFYIKMNGEPHRQVVEIEGLQFIKEVNI